MYCTKCGAAIDDSCAFCTNCGTPVSGSVSAPEVIVTPEINVTPEVIVTPEVSVSGKTEGTLKNSIGKKAHTFMIICAAVFLFFTVIVEFSTIIRNLAIIRRVTGYSIFAIMLSLIGLACAVFFLIFCLNAKKNAKPVIIPFAAGIIISQLALIVYNFDFIRYDGLFSFIRHIMLPQSFRYTLMLAVLVCFIIAVSDMGCKNRICAIIVTALLGLLFIIAFINLFKYYNTVFTILDFLATMFEYTAIALCAFSFRKRQV